MRDRGGKPDPRLVSHSSDRRAGEYHYSLNQSQIRKNSGTPQGQSVGELHRGPSHARVESVDVQELGPRRDEDAFLIR